MGGWQDGDNTSVSARLRALELAINGDGSSATGFLSLSGGTMRGPISGLEDKGGQVANVLSFGCKGDNITDDTVALQAVVSLFGGVRAIYIPSTPNGYKLTSTISLPKGTHIYGDVTNASFYTRLNWTSTGSGFTQILTSGSISRTIIERLSFTQSNSSNAGFGIYLFGGSSITLRDYSISSKWMVGLGLAVLLEANSKNGNISIGASANSLAAVAIGECLEITIDEPHLTLSGTSAIAALVIDKCSNAKIRNGIYTCVSGAALAVRATNTTGLELDGGDFESSVGGVYLARTTSGITYPGTTPSGSANFSPTIKGTASIHGVTIDSGGAVSGVSRSLTSIGNTFVTGGGPCYSGLVNIFNGVFVSIGDWVSGTAAPITDGTSAPNGTFIISTTGTSDQQPTTTVTTSYASTIYDRTILASATGGALTVTLLGAGPPDGLRQTIVKKDASANTVTPVAGSGSLIPAVVLSSQGDRVTYESDGTNWYQVG